MNITELVQRLDPGALIELFELDLRPITNTDGPNDRLFFHAGTNELNGAVVWQTNVYQPFPVQADGFDLTTRGTLPRPKIRIANVTRIITPLLAEYDDLVGAIVIRRRTFARYLDSANFPALNSEADPNQHLPDDLYYIERKVNGNRQMVEWELASAMDLEGIQLPSRPIAINFCPWGYRSPECNYVGTNYFDVRDQPVATAALDVCSKSVSGCKVRFGAKAILPFGGFPGAKTYRY